jgi:hypothetical protein
MSERFLNDCRGFHADCVSHRRPGKSVARSFAHRAACHAQAYPLRALVLGVGVPPTLARPPMTLPLTRLVTAHALPVAGTRMRAEPATADSTRARAEHNVALPDPADLTPLRFPN